MEFEPYSAIGALIAAVVVALVMLFGRRFGRRKGAVRFSSTRAFDALPNPLRARLRWIVPALRVLAIVCILVALARPRQGDEITQIKTSGIAIQMVADRSGSMKENRMRFEGQWMPRLEVVKRVFKQFVLGDGDELEGRPNDMIGLTTFARFAQEECPLTLDHGGLVGFIESLTPAETQVEDGTNISDALYQAVLSLIVADDFVRDTYGREDEYRILSKIIIVLTDGEQTGGYPKHDFDEVSEFAAKNDIKIYPIAIKGEYDRRATFSLRSRSIDTRELRKVAEATGGILQEATDGESLRRIYENIDELERTEFEETFRRYHELFVWPVLGAIACVVLEVLLACTLFRRIP